MRQTEAWRAGGMALGLLSKQVVGLIFQPTSASAPLGCLHRAKGKGSQTHRAQGLTLVPGDVNVVASAGHVGGPAVARG